MLAVGAFFGVRAAPGSAAPELGPGAIAAVVRDAGGRPVQGVLVIAAGPAMRRSITGSAGIATLQALPVGTYDVRVTRAGYEPFGRQVKIVRGGVVPTILDVRFALASFADVRDVASALAAPALGSAGDPLVAHALAAVAGVDIVPLPRGAGSAPSLAGTSGGQTRVELDGIPIAGGPSGFAALRFRDALPLEDIEVVAPPDTSASTVRNAVGGIVNYRTPSIERGSAGALEFGYDSQFGAFQHARFMRTFGRLGLLTDAVTGGGENRSQTVKARYAFSSATSLGFASFGSQSAADIGAARVTNVAPESALDLRTSLGGGALKARRFESASRTASEPYGFASPRDDARIAGVQIGFDLPQAQNVLHVGFDRRSESDLPSGVAELRETFTALTLRGNLRLSNAARLEVGDSYSGGTLLRPRHDPHVAVAFTPVERLTLRLAAGGAYATRSAGIAAVSRTPAAALAPETSFGYRASLDAALGSQDHAWFSAFTLRRYDAFASLADARALGVQVGIERAGTASPFGGIASLDLLRSTAFGAVQPALRALGSFPVAADGQLAAIPFSNARLALTYRAEGSELRLGTTLVGPNNALAAGSVALGDASLAFPFAHVAHVRVALQNVFGAVVTDPALRAYYAPREFTLVVVPDFTK